MCMIFFFFKDTATTGIYTLSLHDALPIWWLRRIAAAAGARIRSGRNGNGASSPITQRAPFPFLPLLIDRKSTRLNSSHGYISYAVFCLKKKIKTHLTLANGEI